MCAFFTRKDLSVEKLTRIVQWTLFKISDPARDRLNAFSTIARPFNLNPQKSLLESHFTSLHLSMKFIYL